MSESEVKICALDLASLEMARALLEDPDVNVDLDAHFINLRVRGCSACQGGIYVSMRFPRNSPLFGQVAQLTSTWFAEKHPPLLPSQT